MVKFHLGANKLRFPSGVTVEQAKKDARKLSKSLSISRSQALDQTAKENGLEMDWGQAIACLKSGRLPLATYRLPLREECVNHLISIFEDRPLITITGPSGSGKSVLALDIARQHLEQQAGKVYYVSWGEADFLKESPPEFLLQDLAYNLGRNLSLKFKSRFVSQIFSFGSQNTDNTLPVLQKGDLVVLDETGYLLSNSYPVEEIVKQDKAVVLMTSQNEDGYGPIASESDRVGCLFLAKQIGGQLESLNRLSDQKTASLLWSFLKSLEIDRGVHSEMCAMTPDPLWVDVVRLRQKNLLETKIIQNPAYRKNVECLKDLSREYSGAILANTKTKLFIAEDKNNTLNIFDSSSSREVLSVLETMAEVNLSPHQEKTVLIIIDSLPRGATMIDFIKACDDHTASQLGISVEKLEAIRPLLRALAPFTENGAYGHLFEQE